jgi:CarboxypepD_reg-like domain
VKIRTWLFAVIALLAASSAQAQQRRITGRVAAVDGGAPLSSASITIVGSTTGTYTNEQGQFSISASDAGRGIFHFEEAT